MSKIRFTPAISSRVTKNMKIFTTILKYLLIAAQLVISAMLLLTLYRFAILQTWQLVAITATLVLLFTFCAWKLIFAGAKTAKAAKTDQETIAKSKTKTKTKNSPKIATKILCVILSLLTIAASAIAYHYLSSVSNFVSSITTETDENPTDKDLTNTPFIVYISGTDSREGIDGVARSDVNILAVVNPKTEKILLLTIPRDTYVQLHGTTGIKDKLTHAGTYGIEMSKATIEDFLDYKIDYTVKVSFDTVVNIVNAIGGIDLKSDTAMDLKVEGGTKICHYVQGWQHLDGDCALRYSRERKTYQTGDNHRGQNQQQVLTAIIEKISKNKSLLLDFPRILKAAEGTFHTSFSYGDITDFVRFQLANNPSWQTESIQIEGTGRYAGTYTMGADTPLYVMDADENSVKSAQEMVDKYLNL